MSVQLPGHYRQWLTHRKQLTIYERIESGLMWHMYRAVQMLKKSSNGAGQQRQRLVRIILQYPRTDRRRRQIWHEWRSLTVLRHRFILRTYSKLFYPSVLLCHITEYCPCTIERYIIESNRSIVPVQMMAWFCQITDAIYYMHRNGVAFLNLHPQTVMLRYQQGTFVCKLFDFSACLISPKTNIVWLDNHPEWFIEFVGWPHGREMAREFLINDMPFRVNTDGCTSVGGNPLFMAPENLANWIPFRPMPADIWSLGMMACYLLAKDLPFSLDNWQQSDFLQQYFAIIRSGQWWLDGGNRPELWPSLEPEAQKIIREMLSFEPDKRPDIRTVWQYFNFEQKFRQLAERFPHRFPLELRHIPPGTENWVTD